MYEDKKNTQTGKEETKQSLFSENTTFYILGVSLKDLPEDSDVAGTGKRDQA